MEAVKGDRLLVHGRTVGRRDKVAEIVEVMGDAGTPPYRVRHENGHESVMAPGPDCVVRHRDPAAPR
ncbi:DUF1918 domain-containing protein [Streptomyces uncialis]|uniref:DUF1918 domain-containing protein n=1 Tax=Streptomyces uncialis TaxID=1048205 RepID=UPI002254CD47|nr:DUF1918 domain-containing protein [Streptomyces uncialis]MCX4662759.1 DUF1918 domain-containing protein [Streptomyces uncialis]WST71364.1 DUF1918 domain-containing protein [Streptomyces uncialis]